MGKEKKFSLRVRELRESDIDKILKIERLSFKTPWNRKLFLRELELDFSFSRVCEIMGSKDWILAGYFFSWLSFEEASILKIAVRPELRGKGIGKWFLSECLAELKRLGVKIVWLEVRVGNLSARNLYSRLGFVEAGKRPGYYQDSGEDALIMVNVIGERGERIYR